MADRPLTEAIAEFATHMLSVDEELILNAAEKWAELEALVADGGRVVVESDCDCGGVGCSAYRGLLAEEAPYAYKDVDEVAESAVPEPGRLVIEAARSVLDAPRYYMCFHETYEDRKDCHVWGPDDGEGCRWVLAVRKESRHVDDPQEGGEE